MAKYSEKRMFEKLGEFSKSNMKRVKQTGLKKYAPGGDWPPKWMTEKGANLYFNPAYQNNFTGSTNSYETYGEGFPLYKVNPSAVVGIEGSLSRGRDASKEAGRGWTYNAYAGLPYDSFENNNFTPSAGLMLDYENSPQDKGFRPQAQLAAEYNPTDGFSISGTSGARFALTPYGNKRVKPGYGVGHLDIYGGGRFGLIDRQNTSGGMIYGARVHGKYMPRWLNKLSKGSYFYGDAGLQFDPVKGKISQAETINTGWGGVDAEGNRVETVISEREPGTKWGATAYANVGIKKEIDDIKFANDKRAKKIQRIEDEEKYAERERQEEEVVKKEEKHKKECPEGEERYCEDCPCEPIERVNHPRWLKYGGLTKFVGGGNPGDKYYRYQNTQYKKDQQGNWYKWNGKSWSPSGSGNGAYDVQNYIYLEDFLQRGSMQADDSNWGNDKPKATVSNYEIQRNQTLNSPFATTTQKIKATNAPLASNVKIQKDLYAQKEKEDKRKELEKLEEQRQQHLRTVGSDNTRVDNSIITNNSLGDIPNVFEQMESVTKAQKDAARAIVNKGEFAQHFPDLYKEYLSEENSNREGGPLTMEEIALREMRSNPDFFSTLESRKEKTWRREEQQAYDDLAWYDKGLNALQSFIADPIMVPANAMFRGQRPLVGQGEWSIDPSRMSEEDNYYYDKISDKSNSTFNNMFNMINVARSGAGAGLALREGDYGDAVYELATVIPMIKGAKYGVKAISAINKAKPLRALPGLAASTSPWANLTGGQLLGGYGMYHAGAYDFPQAFDAYGRGDYGAGNEKMFMGLLNTIPFVAEAKAGIPSFLDDTKTLTNKLFKGNTRPLSSTSNAGVSAENAIANSNLASAGNTASDVNATDFYEALNAKQYKTTFLSEEDAAKLLKNQPGIKTVSYEGESWPTSLAPELRTTDAVKKEFDLANDFATQWAIQDPSKFNEIGKQWSVLASESANLKKNPLIKVQTQLENMLFDDWLKSQGLSEQEISELAINAFRSPEARANWDDLFAEALPIIQERIAASPDMYNQYALSKRLNLKSAKLDQQIKEIPKLIEQTVDPVMKDKIRALYEGAGLKMPEEIGTYNFGTVGADRNKLLFLKPGFEKSPEFLSLSPSDQAYIIENWEGIGGVRTSDATITLGSTPSTTRFLREPRETILGYDEIITPAPEFKFYDPRSWKNYGLKPTTQYEPKWGYAEGTVIEPTILENKIAHYKLPENVGGTQAHEVGHDIQRMYDDWSKIIGEYDATYGYYTGSDKNAIAAEFKNAMVEPTLPEASNTIGGKNADFTLETWKSSTKELHSELMKKRFEATKYYMNAYPDMTMKDAINHIKELEAAGDTWLIDNFYLSDADGWHTLNKHFKPTTSLETKRRLIQMLPGFAMPLGIGIGIGMSQQESEESGIPQNRYGGNIKTLSKFIRK
jgi:hypothetical protein